MQVFHHYDITKKHTFGIETTANQWIEFSEQSELIDYIGQHPLNKVEHFVIGSGSNVLFTENYKGTIIKPNFTYIEMAEKNDDAVFLKAGAGVVWDTFVQYCVEHQFWGVENLSLIPGCVGAAPVQNVGAYGTEAKDVIYQVLAIDKMTGKLRLFEHSDCQFGYRNSYFKRTQNWIILEVVFKLSVKPKPNISYKPLNQIFNKLDTVDIQSIRDVVVSTRNEKLPNPEELGSAGSFFKNPLVDKSQIQSLLKQFPEMPYYPFEDGYKLAAGWLIDQLGWKGKTEGGAAVHKQQALVLINDNKAKGTEVLNLSKKIQKSVYECFGIVLEPEVIII